MNTTILARDMMTKKLFTLTPDMDVFSAIDVLLSHRISGAPVVSSNGEFHGIFSESSCMRFIVNAAYDQLPDAGLMPFVDRSPPSIAPDTDLLTICQTFVDQGVRRLPVLEEGKLLGQISRRDVMRAVRNMVSEHKTGAHAQLLYISAILEDSQAITARLNPNARANSPM